MKDNGANDVCDGCWRVGACERPTTCTCPCNGGVRWRHADDKRKE